MQQNQLHHATVHSLIHQHPNYAEKGIETQLLGLVAVKHFWGVESVLSDFVLKDFGP